MIAKCDVFIPAGRTGLDPKKTAFFQNLQIQTKIQAAQIDIVSTKQVINKGDKIGSTQVKLLDLLKITPFKYKMEIKNVLVDGNVYDAGFLNLTTDNILAKFK